MRAFSIWENTGVGLPASGQSDRGRVSLYEGVADGTDTMNVRDVVSDRSAQGTVRLARLCDVDLVIAGAIFH